MNTHQKESTVQKLSRYLKKTDLLPHRGAKGNITRISKDSGVSRESLYNNTDCREMLNHALEKQGLEKIEVRDENDTVDYSKKLISYLKKAEKLPERNGKVNITSVSDDSGIPRHVLYDDPCRNILNNACMEQKLCGINEQMSQKDDRDKMLMEKKIAQLEKKNASLVAEVFELRRQVKRLSEIEKMYTAGRRIIP